MLNIGTFSLAVIVYFIIVNIFAFFIFGADKLFAKANAHRVRERTLLLLALFGGSAGALLGMQIFRHKTKKVGFQMLMAVILLIQVGIGLWLYTAF